MNNERLDDLFREIREEKIETSVKEVNKWIALSAASIGLFGLLSQFKLSFLLTKKMIIMTTILATIGIGITTIFFSATSNKETSKSNITAKSEMKNSVSPTKKLVMIETNPKVERENTKPHSDSENTPSKEINNEAMNHSPLHASSMERTLEIKPQSTFITKSRKGDYAVQERQVGPFTKLSIGSSFNVFISQGETESVRLEVDEKYIDLVETNVNRNQLDVSFKCGSTIKNPEKMDVYITMKTIDELNFSGAANVKSMGNLNFNTLEIEGAGAANIKLQLSGQNLKLYSSGAANIEITGQADIVNLEGSGASNIEINKLEIKDLKARTSGASKVSCSVTGELKINASGASHVKYSGNPSSVDITESGAAKISKKG